jgi:hypothetical protein
MGLHHRYYADDIDYLPTLRTQPYAEMQNLRTPPYAEMQKQIGKLLREQYQPPQELPDQLFVLLLKVEQQGKIPSKKLNGLPPWSVHSHQLGKAKP